MGKRIDLTGQRFGKLAVIKELEPTYNTSRKYTQRISNWECLCDCGNIVSVRKTNLTHGNKDRGCVNCAYKGMGKGRVTLSNELVGEKFGRLTVIKDSGKRSHSVLWECICECGNTTWVVGGSLKAGKTRSCGCLSKETTRETGISNASELTGMVFDRLTVMEKTDKRSSQFVLWKCLCICGKTTLVTTTNLIQHHTKSCGCIAEEGIKEGTRASYLGDTIGKNNTSGVRGVGFDKKSNKWRATIGFQNKLIYLGTFNRKQDAINARKEAEDKYFKPVLEKYGRSNQYGSDNSKSTN